MECPFKKQIITKETRQLNGDKTTTRETSFLPCVGAECAAYKASEYGCGLVSKGVKP